VLLACNAIPVVDQLIGSIRNPWCLAEYKAPDIADVLLDYIESVANVDAQLLKSLIRNADSSIAIPIFDSHLLGGHLFSPPL